MQPTSSKRYLTPANIARSTAIVASMFTNGLGMTLTRLSCMGTEPFTCVNYAISERFGLPLAASMISINAILLLACLAFLPTSLGFGTIANMTLGGVFGDFWMSVITGAIGHEVVFSGTEHLVLRVLLMGAGMLVMVTSASFYISAGLGMSPYDAFGYIAEKLTGGRVRFRWARVATDCTCVLVAYLLASATGTQWELIGVGTVVMACCLGPLLSWLNDHVAGPVYRSLAANLEATS